MTWRLKKEHYYIFAHQIYNIKNNKANLIKDWRIYAIIFSQDYTFGQIF